MSGDLYKGFWHVLQGMERRGYRFSDTHIMDVEILDPGNEIVKLLYQDIDLADISIDKIYFQHGINNKNVFGILIFYPDALSFVANINLSFERQNHSQIKMYLDQLHAKIPLGNFQVINDSAYYMARFNYECFTNIDDVARYLSVSILSSYSMLLPELLELF